MYKAYIKIELLLNIKSCTHEVKWKYLEFVGSLKVAAVTDFLPKPRTREMREETGEGEGGGGGLATSTGCGDKCRSEEAFLEKENCKMNLRGHGEEASGYSHGRGRAE